jgi:hypothetical protein
LPVAEIKHAIVPMHAGVPPPSAPPPVGQQSCPAPPHAAHIPGMPMPALRPPQARPGVGHEPVLPVPQQGWPAAPHAPHWAPVADSWHDMPVMHAVMPASAPPEPTVQQGCPAPPHVPHIPGVPALAIRIAQPRPGMHEPPPPFPQQTCPDAPQAAHLSPVGEMTHDRPVLHSV